MVRESVECRGKYETCCHREVENDKSSNIYHRGCREVCPDVDVKMKEEPNEEHCSGEVGPDVR